MGEYLEVCAEQRQTRDRAQLRGVRWQGSAARLTLKERRRDADV